MPLLDTTPSARALLHERLADEAHTVVFALCAAWCSTCREFRAACEAVARSRPAVSLVWVDIEDDAALVGDLDIETFPTLAIFAGDVLRHFGAVLPQASLLERLIDEPAALFAADAPDEVRRLVAALRPR
jgi:thioredoxin reductase (NADPH)